MKKISILSIILFIAVIQAIGCKSYTIQYDQSLESKTINAGLFVDSIPAVTADFDGIIKYPIHGKAVEDAFNATSIKDLLFEEIKKNGSKISTKINVSVNDDSEKSLPITKVENADKLDTNQCEYIFKDIPSKFGRDYIMTISVISWGFSEKSFSSSAYIECIVSIIEIKSSKKIWQEKLRSETSFPTFSLGYSDAKDPQTVNTLLKNCVTNIVQQISTEINKKNK